MFHDLMMGLLMPKDTKYQRNMGQYHQNLFIDS